MAQRVDPELSIKMTTEIVVAYVSRNAIERSQIAQLILEIRGALEGPVADTVSLGAVSQVSTYAPALDIGVEAATVRPPLSSLMVLQSEPAVPIASSITDDYIICLEDGGHYRSLRRHLMAKYGLSPDQYRHKWGLPSDYPMVAPSYARERSDVAKRTGLGYSTKTTKAPRKGASR